MAKPAEYNLQGIKERLKKRYGFNCFERSRVEANVLCNRRIESVDEVHRRHQSDADRASDDLFAAKSEIERLEAEIPDITKKHRFYQELRGYVTDLIECFDEKVGERIRCIYDFLGETP